jgi:hypothetical protein
MKSIGKKSLFKWNFWGEGMDEGRKSWLEISLLYERGKVMNAGPSSRSRRGTTVGEGRGTCNASGKNRIKEV